MRIKNINEIIDKNKLKNIYDSLKKGDEITVTYDTSISKGLTKTLKVVKDKTKVGSRNIERITLVNSSNPKAMKYYLYNKDGRITFATGDMGAVITNINEASDSKELKTASDMADLIMNNQHHFAMFLKPKRVRAFANGNKLSVSPASNSFTIVADYSKKQIEASPKPEYPESVAYSEILGTIQKSTGFKVIKINESMNESNNEPQIITQLRDVVKNGYKTLKDPKSGKKMRVDTYSASAIVGVYDKLNDVNKQKFSSMGLLGMQSVAFKILNK